MINIIIGIQNIGIDAGPFDLYSDVDNFTTAFETGISKVDIELGYNTQAPDNSTIIRCQSTGVCDNFLDITITAQPTTTTTTSTTTSTTTTSTTTTTLPPTTTSTTLPPTTTTTSTTSTTTLNRILTITNVTFDGSQFRVFFEATNFTLSALVYEISNDAVNWYTPGNYIDIDTTSPQVFNPGLYFESFYIRIFDNDSGIVTYSDPFLYTDPVTTSTTTTTTLPPGNYLITNSSSSAQIDDVSVSCPHIISDSYPILPGQQFIGTMGSCFGPYVVTLSNVSNNTLQLIINGSIVDTISSINSSGFYELNGTKTENQILEIRLS
jgi:hypothetical protein